MSLKSDIGIGLFALALGAGLEYKFNPPTTKEITKDVVHTQIQTVVKTVRLPSGEVDTTVTTDKDIVNTLSDIKTQVSLNVPKNYLISGSYGMDLHTNKPSYGVDVKYRVIGPVFIGGEYTFDGSIRGSLGFEF